VVVGIIALLLSVLLPALSAARRASMRTLCLSHQRELSTALLARSQQHGGYLPLAGKIELPDSVGPFHDLPALLYDTRRSRYEYTKQLAAPFPTFTVLAPFQVSLYRHLAPDDLDISDGWREDRRFAESRHAELVMCPSSGLESQDWVKPAEGIWVGEDGFITQSFLPLEYALNAGIMGFHHSPRYAQRRLRGQLARAGSASSVILLGDADPRPPTSETLSWAPPLDVDSAYSLADVFDSLGTIASGQASFDAFRHDGYMNVVFADGHTQTVLIQSEALSKLQLVSPE
jgi:prepilin-type processing-associated H-X9-DG protein